MTQKQGNGFPGRNPQTHAQPARSGKPCRDKDNKEQIIDREMEQQQQLINNQINKKWKKVA